MGVGSGTAAVSNKTVKFTIRPRFNSTVSCEVITLGLSRVSVYTSPVMQGSLELSDFEDQAKQPLILQTKTALTDLFI